MKNIFMKKGGVLIFVIASAVAIFGCKKKNSPNEDFEIYMKELQSDFGIVFLEKNENEFFLPIELLEKDNLKDSVYLFNEKFKRAFVFQDESLKERNVGLKKSIQYYANQKINWDDEVLSDSLQNFSIIDVLNAEAVDEKLSPEEQFAQIRFRLKEIPTYFSKAKELIKKPTKQKLKNAIKQYSKDYFYLKNELSLLIRKPDILKEDQIDFSQKNEEAQLAVKDFIAFLNSLLFELNN